MSRSAQLSCHKCFPGLVDRFLILCIVFSPIMIIDHYALAFLYGVKDESSRNSWLLVWPLKYGPFENWGMTIYYIITGLGLFLYENYLLLKSWNKKFLKFVERYAPLIIGIIILLICIFTFSWLHKVNVVEHGEIKILKTVAYIFNYNLYLILPLLCLLPILTIVSKTGKAQYSTDYFFNFYKILYIENPVLVIFVLILALTPFALIKFYSDVKVSADDEMRMWQFSMVLAKVLTPMIIILPTFAKLIKNFEKSIENHCQVKLRQIISNMDDLVVIFGYGYLGNNVLFELKERGIVHNNDVSEVMTPELEKRKVYNNLIIIDHNQSIFKNVLTDSIFGSIGLIESIHEKEFADENDVFMIGMVGDVANETILNKIFKAAIESDRNRRKALLISTVPDYTVTDKLVKYMSSILCVVACHDLFQFKSFLPKTEEDTKRTLGMLYTPYLEGEILGRSILAETLRWRYEDSSRKGLPKILIIGGNKSSYYLQETYLIGLRQSGIINENEKDVNICYLSNDEFYKKRMTKTIQSQNDINYNEYSESIRYPDAVYNNFVVKSKVIIGEPARLRTIIEIIHNEKVRPQIIVITHENADMSVKLLEEWTNIIKNSQSDGYKPKVFIGTKGKEKRIKDILNNYERLNGNNSTTYPMQKYDCMVQIYDDSRELIGAISETFKRKLRRKEMLINNYGDPLYIYFCVRNQFGLLARLCNKLAKLNADLPPDNSMPDDQDYSVVSFQNFKLQNCPGEKGTSKNNRFIIESDVVLTKTNKEEMQNITRVNTREFICKSLVIPNEQKKFINKFVGDRCYDENCMHKELCLNNKERNNNGKEPSNGNPHTKGACNDIPLARIFICANNYSVPGSIAHVLNNLLILKTTPETINDNESLVDLTYIKSFSCFEDKIHKKEFYGNMIAFNKNVNEYRETLFKETFISDITICPITDNNAWERYSVNLTNFLIGTYKTDFVLCEDDNNKTVKDKNNIVIRTATHNRDCGQKCGKCRRLIENKLDKDMTKES